MIGRGEAEEGGGVGVAELRLCLEDRKDGRVGIMAGG